MPYAPAPGAQQASAREAYEAAFRQTYGAPAAENSPYAHAAGGQAQRAVHEPQRTMAFQPYGQPTGDSAAYSEWAQAQQGREFDMTVGKKKMGRGKKAAVIVVSVLVLAVLGVGIGAFAYMNHLDSLMGFKNKDEINLVLQDVNGIDPYYVLLIGSDSREGVADSDAEWAGISDDAADERSDVLILARVDETNRQVTMLSIPRDTAWQYSDGSWGKLNSVYRNGGAAASVSAVSELTGVPIAHVVEIRMSGFMQLVDTLGGITVYVPQAITYHEALTNTEMVIEAGEQRLNGAQAETYARERVSYNGNQDAMRQSKIRVIVQAMYNEIKGKPVTELPGLVASCAECVTTDLTSGEIMGILNALGGDPVIYSGTGPTDGDNDPYVDGQWLCYVNPTGWARVMDVVKSGGDPSSVSYEGDETWVAGS